VTRCDSVSATRAEAQASGPCRGTEGRHPVPVGPLPGAPPGLGRPAHEPTQIRPGPAAESHGHTDKVITSEHRHPSNSPRQVAQRWSLDFRNSVCRYDWWPMPASFAAPKFRSKPRAPGYPTRSRPGPAAPRHTCFALAVDQRAREPPCGPGPDTAQFWPPGARAPGPGPHTVRYHATTLHRTWGQPSGCLILPITAPPSLGPDRTTWKGEAQISNGDSPETGPPT
jgi:hypothetical protein